MVAVIWLGSIVSLGILAFMALAVKSDLASFRSCNANSSGLSITSCGKQGLNIGDILLLGLFILSAALVVTLLTAASRTIRGRAG
jgi:hypothetical protein